VDVVLLTYSYFSTATDFLTKMVSLYSRDFHGACEQLVSKYRVKILFVINLWLQRNVHRLIGDTSFCSALSNFVACAQIGKDESPGFAYIRKWLEKNFNPQQSPRREKSKVLKHFPTTPSCLDFPEENVAHQMIYIDNKLFRAMKFSDFLHKNFETPHASPGYTLMMQRFNTWGAWVATEIVTERTATGRAKVISFFIKVAQICLEMQSFNTAYAVIAGLGNSSVERLKQTWALVEKDVLAKHKNLQNVFDMTKNYLNYRTLLQASSPPLVPYLGLYPKDLFAVEENVPTKNDQGLISLPKLRKLHEIIKPLLEFQAGKNYVIKTEPLVHRYLKSLKVMGSEDIYQNSLLSEPKVSSPAMNA